MTNSVFSADSLSWSFSSKSTTGNLLESTVIPGCSDSALSTFFSTSGLSDRIVTVARGGILVSTTWGGPTSTAPVGVNITLATTGPGRGPWLAVNVTPIFSARGPRNPPARTTNRTSDRLSGRTSRIPNSADVHPQLFVI